LLATACDGTLATTAQFTSVRVVCNNTCPLHLGNASSAIKVPHRSQFDPDAVKRQLGITVSSWEGFVTRMKALVARPVDPDTVEGLLRRVLTYAAPDGKTCGGQRAGACHRPITVRRRWSRCADGVQPRYGVGSFSTA
jgi:hypothetical protein